MEEIKILYYSWTETVFSNIAFCFFPSGFPLCSYDGALMLLMHLLEYVDPLHFLSTHGLAIENNSSLLRECVTKTQLNSLLNQKYDNVLSSEKAYFV